MRAIDLYKIISGGVEYRLTSAADEQTHNLEAYDPAPIGRGGYQVRNELSKANLEVRIGLGHALATALLSSWAETPTTLTLFRKRTASTSTAWKGRLASVRPADDHVLMVFESIFTSLRRPGLRARFQKTCRHALYARGCFLDPEDFADAATLDEINGNVVTVPEAALEPDGWYAGGMVKAPDGTLSYVSVHAGTLLTLNRVSSSLAAAFAVDGPGTAITLYPGCAHNYATCRDKFANDDNYGGFDYIPSKNPMGGSSIV